MLPLQLHLHVLEFLARLNCLPRIPAELIDMQAILFDPQHQVLKSASATSKKRSSALPAVDIGLSSDGSCETVVLLGHSIGFAFCNARANQGDDPCYA